MGEHELSSRLRSMGIGLLAAVSITSLAMTPMTASAAPQQGGASLSGVRVTPSGVTAILTARTGLGAAQIDPASVKATIKGVGTPVSVKPAASERRVATLLIDTSASMGVAGMQTVLRSVDVFLASVPKDVYVGAVSYSTPPVVVGAPTLDLGALRAAIAGLKSDGETSLYDGIAVALTQLGTSGERSFVLISDGADTRSRRTQDQTIAALSASGVRAQVVGFNTDTAHRSLLTRLSVAGNGSISEAGSAAAVSAAFVSAAQAYGSQIRVDIKVPPSAGGLQPLVVSAIAGGKTFQGDTVINLAVQKPAPSVVQAPSTVAASDGTAPPQVPANGPLGVGLVLWLALLAVFLGFGGVVAFLVAPTYVSRHHRRVESIEGYVTVRKPTLADERSTVTAIANSLVNLGDKVMDGRTSTPKTQRLLERADLPLRPGEWAVLRVVVVIVGLVGGMLLTRGGSLSTFLGAGAGLLVGTFSPALILKFLASHRAKKFESQLPDVLTLVASSLATGFSLLQALDAVASDSSEPSAKEFSRALAETRIGADLNDSLEHLADRMDSDNLRWTGMAISIQRQVGGNLAETLRNTATTLRDRQALSRHVKALSAEGKLSAYILVALPIGVFIYMLGVNRAYVELLWTSMIGIGMLGSGLVSMTLGILWMRKVVTVEV